jgi:hypothetical protein
MAYCIICLSSLEFIVTDIRILLFKLMQWYYRVQAGILVLGIHVFNISDDMCFQELA